MRGQGERRRRETRNALSFDDSGAVGYSGQEAEDKNSKTGQRDAFHQKGRRGRNSLIDGGLQDGRRSTVTDEDFLPSRGPGCRPTPQLSTSKRLASRWTPTSEG